MRCCTVALRVGAARVLGALVAGVLGPAVAQQLGHGARVCNLDCGRHGVCDLASGACVCDRGFEGDRCEVNIDDCANALVGPDACLNGGTCIDGLATFTCECAAGFSGWLCQSDMDECASHPCMNGATCIESSSDRRIAPQAFWCKCASGFGGEECGVDIDECADSPCEHGGTCTNLMGDFRCSCALGWAGSTCDSLSWRVPFLLGAALIIVMFVVIDLGMQVATRCEQVQQERAAAGVEFNAKDVLLDSADPACCNWRLSQRGCWPGSCDAWCLALKILLSGVKGSRNGMERRDSGARVDVENEAT